jgi:hypothetical protein
MAKVINKSGEKVVIWYVREFLPQRFQAPGWTDLRIGFLLSIVGPVDPTDDDDPTAVSAEEIGTPPRPFLATSDRFFIGVIDSVTGQTFMGFTNVGLISHNGQSAGTSKLVSSDGGVGTSNAYFWRPMNEINTAWTMAVVDGDQRRAVSRDGSQIHFPQDTTGAGGYAVLLMLRLQRDNAGGRAKIISVSTKLDTTNHSGDVLFTNTPTAALLESNLVATFPTPAQTLGPIELANEPDSLYIYWPFHDSRIRAHAIGIYKAS